VYIIVPDLIKRKYFQYKKDNNMSFNLGAIACFNSFYVCMDCGEVATECMEEKHDGHEYYYLGNGEEAVTFLNEYLKEPLKKVLEEQKEKIKNRPPSPAFEYSDIELTYESFFPSSKPRVSEVEEENPKISDAPKIDESKTADTVD
jgi:hypothetical protein